MMYEACVGKRIFFVVVYIVMVSFVSGSDHCALTNNTICDDLTNISECEYDAGACCPNTAAGDILDTMNCIHCLCLDPVASIGRVLNVDACSTLPDDINSVVDGGTIELMAGVYDLCSGIVVNHARSVVIAADASVTDASQLVLQCNTTFGFFVKDESNVTIQGPMTLIGCNERAMIVTGNASLTVSSVVFAQHSAGALASVFIANGDSDVLFSDCVFMNNTGKELRSSVGYIDDQAAVVIEDSLLTQNVDKMFHVTGSSKLTMYRVTLSDNIDKRESSCILIDSDGWVEVKDSFITGNTGFTGGSFSIKDNGRLYITGSILSQNAADTGGCIYMTGTGKLFVRNSSIEENKANLDTSFGSVLFGVGSSYAEFHNCRIKNNAAFAGTLSFFQHTLAQNLIVEDCEFSENSAIFTADIYTYGISVRIHNSTFTNSKAKYLGAIGCNNVQLDVVMYNITDSSFVNIEVIEWGGAMGYWDGCDMRITRSVFKGCFAKRGGIFIALSQHSSATFDQCIFIDNKAEEGGLIAGTAAGTVVIRRSSLLNNRADVALGARNVGKGGAFFISDGLHIRLEESTIRNSIAGLSGGVSHIDSGTFEAVNSYFYGNQASENGAVGFVLSSSAKETKVSILHCVLEDNIVLSPTSRGGVFFVSGSTSISLLSSTFRNNSASLYGGVLLFEKTPTFDISQCIFERNSASGGTGGGGGVIANFNDGALDSSIKDCLFRENFAFHGGVIFSNNVKYLLTEENFTNCTFEDNKSSGVAGDDFASPIISLRWTTAVPNFKITSGETLPTAISILSVDYYGNVLQTGIDELAIVNLKSSEPDLLRLTGEKLKGILDQGRLSFSDLVVHSNTRESYDGTIIVSAHLMINRNIDIPSLNFSISIQPCFKGFVEVDSFENGFKHCKIPTCSPACTENQGVCIDFNKCECFHFYNGDLCERYNVPLTAFDVSVIVCGISFVISVGLVCFFHSRLPALAIRKQSTPPAPRVRKTFWFTLLQMLFRFTYEIIDMATDYAALFAMLREPGHFGVQVPYIIIIVIATLASFVNQIFTVRSMFDVYEFLHYGYISAHKSLITMDDFVIVKHGRRDLSDTLADITNLKHQITNRAVTFLLVMVEDIPFMALNLFIIFSSDETIGGMTVFVVSSSVSAVVVGFKISRIAQLISFITKYRTLELEMIKREGRALSLPLEKPPLHSEPRSDKSNLEVISA